MFSKTTHDITVTATPQFLPDHSEPEDDHFVWAYTIQLENRGNETVQLMNRYWRITDDSGQTQEVRGPGVIGEQPVLKPGESFRYTSGTALSTPSGLMLGTYEMADPAGSRFEIEIPAFSLDSPYILSRAN
jgi:ApaG protein